LQRLARAEGRTTQQAFELYVHERFLARLANSRFAERLVLKGGMLLAALDARRATRDADMLARGIDNDMENLRDVVSEIAAIELTDGVVFRCRTHLAGHNPRGRKIRGHPSCRARKPGWCCLEAATRSVIR
jgi:predicted nucleotidyltransferase component of viral defense system